MTLKQPMGTGATRLAQSQTIHVLLSEPLHFNDADILDALRADFPEMDWSGKTPVTLSTEMRESAGIHMFPCGPHTPPGVIMPNPYALAGPWARLAGMNYIDPDGAQSKAIAGHAAHVSISVGTNSNELVARVEAARRATACAAVLAELPIAIAVYVEAGNRLISPQKWAEAARDIRAGDTPLMSWVLPALFEDPEVPNHITGTTIGLAAFLGREIEIRQAPVPLAEAGQIVLSAASMLIDLGHTFRDGETMGPTGDDAVPYRVRLLPENTLGNDCERWSLIHPKSPFKARKILGRPEVRQTPFATIRRVTRPAGPILRKRWGLFAKGPDATGEMRTN